MNFLKKIIQNIALKMIKSKIKKKVKKYYLLSNDFKNKCFLTLYYLNQELEQNNILVFSLFRF